MTIDSGFNHITVLLDEAVEALALRADGCYLDGTFGRGGHSRLILSKLGPQGRLLGSTKIHKRLRQGKRWRPKTAACHCAAQLAEMGDEVARRGLDGKVSGILLDLGVSSPQLDDPERGFSFLNDGPLDMRMNPDQGISAAEFIATAPEDEIARVFKEYGEERFAKRMARAVVQRREQQPFTRTGDLAEVLKVANPAWEKGKNPATRADAQVAPPMTEVSSCQGGPAPRSGGRGTHHGCRSSPAASAGGASSQERAGTWPHCASLRSPAAFPAGSG